MKLDTQEYMNPYYINGKQVHNIHFYDDTGIVASVGAGWIGTNGSNRTNIKELDQLEFNRALKLDLTKKRHFFIKSTETDHHFDEGNDIYIYLPAADLTVEPLGEEASMKTDDRVYYGEYFNLTATFKNRHTGEWQHRTEKLMRRTYTRSELTPAGEKQERFIAALDKYGFKLESTYRLAEFLGREDFINDVAEVLHS